MIEIFIEDKLSNISVFSVWLVHLTRDEEFAIKLRSFCALQKCQTILLEA